jgi:enamine deaminase RidA (YjgF/YER057c/UK114 family)
MDVGNAMTGACPDGPSALARSADQLRSPRKNLLLAASIETDTSNAAVRIRNLSESGAMLDGAVLPDVGKMVTLRRLEVQVGAVVVWRLSGRCGIKFDGNVVVDDWVAGAHRTASAQISGQARVDAIQAAIRKGESLRPEDVPSPAALATDELESRIVEELDHILRLLEAIGDRLSDDGLFTQRYSAELQSFDAARQALAHLNTVLASPDRLAAVNAITTQELKSRLLRRANF